MFEVELRSADSDKNSANEKLNALKKVVECLVDIVDQMEIKCSDSGLSIQVMDELHVALAEVLFSKDAFSSYRCDRDVQLGIPAKLFLNILKGINLEDRSTLRFSCEDTPESLKIEHIHPDFHYEFCLSLYQIGREYYEIPQMDYDLVVKMRSEQLRTITKLIGSFGDYINFECDGGKLHVRQRGDLLKNDMSLGSNGDTVTIESNSPINQEIAMKYMNLINKISTLSESVNINFGKASPVFFEINMEKIGHVKFYIAPKAAAN